MIQNPTESVNALTKLADVIGKKTLVMWCIVTTFTTGYLFIDGRAERDKRITENSASYERLLDEVRGIKKREVENKKQVDSFKPQLDSLVGDVKQTLKSIQPVKSKK